MAWSDSGVIAYYVLEMGNASVNVNHDAYKGALFGNSVVPVQQTAASVAYAGSGSTWSTGNETSGTGYTAGGVAVTPTTWTQGSTASNTQNIITFTSSGTPQWLSSTFTAYGIFVYDTTYAGTSNLGFTFNYFGGAEQVTSGTFTVNWNASGVAAFSCATG